MQQVGRPATELGRPDPVHKVPRETGRSAEHCTRSTEPLNRGVLMHLVAGRSAGCSARSTGPVARPLPVHPIEVQPPPNCIFSSNDTKGLC